MPLPLPLTSVPRILSARRITLILLVTALAIAVLAARFQSVVDVPFVEPSAGAELRGGDGWSDSGGGKSERQVSEQDGDEDDRDCDKCTIPREPWLPNRARTSYPATADGDAFHWISKPESPPPRPI